MLLPATGASIRLHNPSVSRAQVVDDILDITATTEQLGKTAGKDLATDKTTYPSILGLEKSRQVAEDLIADAKLQLEGYDKLKAAPLLAMADYIYSRSN